MKPVSRRQAIRTFAAFGAAIAMSSVSRGQPTTAPTTAPSEEPIGDPGFTTNPVAIEELAPNLKHISGPGGNITVLAGSDGPIVIDSGIPPRAADVLEAAKKAADGAAPRTLINTHWHFDHVGGNAQLVGAGVNSVYAHENTLVRMSSEQKNSFMGMTFPPAAEAAKPNVTFSERMALRRNGEVLSLVSVAPAHTDGDIAIHFENANVLVTGDLFFNKLFPFIDYDSKGSIEGMIAASEQLLKLADDKTKIVPGHGDLASRSDLVLFHEMLVAVKDRLAKLAAAGMSINEVQAARPLADLDATWGRRMLHGSNVVRMIYPHLVKS